jgi:hypothetical protein
MAHVSGVIAYVSAAIHHAETFNHTCSIEEQVVNGHIPRLHLRSMRVRQPFKFLTLGPKSVRLVQYSKTASL